MHIYPLLFFPAHLPGVSTFFAKKTKIAESAEKTQNEGVNARTPFAVDPEEESSNYDILSA